MAWEHRVQRVNSLFQANSCYESQRIVWPGMVRDSIKRNPSLDISLSSSSDLRCFVICVFAGRLFDRVDLIKLVSNAYPCVHTYVCPSTKIFSDCNEIWRVGRG